MTAKLVQGTFSNNGTKISADQSILKSLSAIKGPAANLSSMQYVDPGQTIGANFFDREMPQQTNDYARVAFLDRSNALGFSEDKLGRLAEINKT